MLSVQVAIRTHSKFSIEMAPSTLLSLDIDENYFAPKGVSRFSEESLETQQKKLLLSIVLNLAPSIRKYGNYHLGKC
jgi:hypothetical protein